MTIIKTEVSKNLVGIQSITYIRPQAVRVDIVDARPNTRIYPFVDGVRADQYFKQYIGTGTISVPSLPTGNAGPAFGGVDLKDPSKFTALGAPLMTNSVGEIVMAWNIPGGTFTTGDKQLVFADVEDLSFLETIGSVYGSAKAVFNTKGTLRLMQTTITKTNETVRTVYVEQVNYPRDPLAQSFFTYGISGGLFLTGIKLFFQTKDAVMPIRVELRKMINGYPAEYEYGNPDMVSIKNPVDIVTSSDASLGTIFRFPVPVYLKEDSDYAFVILSNSTNYNVWTSKMGERSIETGKLVYEQPYIGSLFRSENNKTWTAEQFEDIKFELLQADYDTTKNPTMTFAGILGPVAYRGSDLTTKNGSNLVVFRANKMTGLTVGSKIKIDCDDNGIYNGISSANIAGERTINRIIDEYTVEFLAGATATSSGKVLSGNMVRAIGVINGGSGYTSAPTVTISAPVSGVTATATATVVNGEVIGIDISNRGSGYTNDPVVVISGGGGSGASAASSTEAMFTITMNKPLNTIVPQFKHQTYPGTELQSALKAVGPGYEYKQPIDAKLSEVTSFMEPLMVASRTNEFLMLSNGNSMELNVSLKSSNRNVSPVIDTRGSYGALLYANAINAQSSFEDTDAMISSSGIATVTISSGGGGYPVAPVVTVIPAENETGTITTPAVITATISGGIVTVLTITNAGAGYTKAPLISIASPNSGTTATASCTINPLNSEINTAGNAYSRYIRKKVVVETVSTGVRLFSLAYSTPQTNFDWYIRTSLSTDVIPHESRPWVKLSCNIPRNRSKAKDEFFEYEHYIDGLASFNTYDLKMVPSSTTSTQIPQIKRFRMIVVA